MSSFSVISNLNMIWTISSNAKNTLQININVALNSVYANILRARLYNMSSPTYGMTYFTKRWERKINRKDLQFSVPSNQQTSRYFMEICIKENIPEKSVKAGLKYAIVAMIARGLVIMCNSGRPYLFVLNFIKKTA